MEEKEVVYGIFIKATPEKIWDALTQSEFTRKYFWGTNVESDWKPGSKIRFFSDDGTTFSEGEVIKAERGKILSQSEWMIGPDGKKGGESVITFEIEKHGDSSKLIVTHVHSAKDHKKAMHGWEMSMSSLKSLLETGEALQLQ
ncbi:MAG: ATPase [Pyrinomonadaceae bacterium]|nr:ATPase [Pyrinomonadaceae bacterium]